MKVEFNFVFDRKKRVKKPADKGLIELRAYLNAKTKYFSTKIEVAAQATTTTVKTAGGGLGLLQGLGNIFSGIAAVKSLKEEE